MKVLIVSRTPWDNSNSFGNTFSNLFEGMRDVEVYNVACRHGISNNSVVKRSVQLTDKTVLKSVYNIRFDPCFEINTNTFDDVYNKEISENARKKRKTFSFIIRDFIWKLGHWKKSKTLNSFISEIKPDIIYLPIYSSLYMCDIQSYIVKKMGVPVVGHISDDVYGNPPKLSLLGKAYHGKLRGELKKLISKCSYLEVFAENMKEEYEQIFKKTCYLIGKGVNVEDIKKPNYTFNDRQLKFVYTGNIGDERYKVLAKIGLAIDEIDFNVPIFLDIYSTTPLTNEMKELFSKSKSIRFMGAISKEKVNEVQNMADYLVHVESFSQKAIFSAKMSFSTKLIDYMHMGKPIFAVGPSEVNSISVLQENGLAIVANEEKDIKHLIQDLLNGNVSLEEIGNNVFNYLSEHRNIKTIQKGIKERLESLLN